MFKLFQSRIYLQIYKNRFVVHHLETGTVLDITSDVPFSTIRLLVGNFTQASKLLKETVKKLSLKYPPVILVHPKEIIDGGISEIEERIFSELAIMAGAKAVKIHKNGDLSEGEVKNILEKI